MRRKIHKVVLESKVSLMLKQQKSKSKNSVGQWPNDEVIWNLKRKILQGGSRVFFKKIIVGKTLMRMRNVKPEHMLKL